MSNFNELKSEHIKKNETEYEKNISELRFIEGSEIPHKTQERKKLLDELKEYSEFGYNDTKVDVSSISPGCRSCGEGTWSCLFINGKCNSRCFYCPTRQESEEVPTTQTIPFPNVNDYLDYIEQFDYRGVSISGGEPLLTPEKTLLYIQDVRKRFGDKVYIWMYTNGTLMTDKLAGMLGDAGVNEIRFDIGATNYNLDKLKLAVDKIETTTVEIPAVPEDYEIMKQKITELKQVGVKHLNLHQMRLTPFNFDNLVGRGYTFQHGEKVSVLDSELTALNLIKYSKEQNINLPINYCSFIYKNRFQRSSARKRNALNIIKPYEEITSNGYIRTIYVTGSELLLSTNWSALENDFPNLSTYDEKTKRLYLKADLLNKLNWEGGKIFLKYGEAVLLPKMSYMNPFKIVEINRNKTVAVEYVKRYEREFESTTRLSNVLNSVWDENDTTDYSLIENFEKVGWGFQDYY